MISLNKTTGKTALIVVLTLAALVALSKAVPSAGTTVKSTLGVG